MFMFNEMEWTETLTIYLNLVFAKEEIVFARTSPKHKLEIGEFTMYSSCSYCRGIEWRASQACSGIGSHCRSVSTYQFLCFQEDGLIWLNRTGVNSPLPLLSFLVSYV